MDQSKDVEFIVEYIVLEVRVARVTAKDREAAEQEVKQYHGQLNSDVMKESVIIHSIEEDK